MSVLRLLREPRWLRGLAVAVLIAFVCLLLGRWQWHRREERLAANAPLVQNYDARPVDVTRVLPAGSELAKADVWTPVRVTGTYDVADTLLVRNRPRDDTAGYEVLVPLVLGDGTALVVDRGWLAAGDDTDRPDTLPAPAQGEVTVVARLRQWEEAKRGTVPPGQVGSIGRAQVAAAVPGLRLLDGYAVLATEDPSAATAPAPALRPDVDEGPHLAYTVQWFGFALTALVVWVVAGRRELDLRAGETGESEEAGETTEGERIEETVEAVEAAPAPRRGARRTVRSGVDEQAEDAELDAADQRF
ncbi:SURF1 family protein [Kineococcus sp. R86509]|uniref:SURF1 family cytochrome oxidase biogenesis protein n=1 Tax=Kineococcus sp. R86509 TaxID=3093851 RepID=UPI0036D33259